MQDSNPPPPPPPPEEEKPQPAARQGQLDPIVENKQKEEENSREAFQKLWDAAVERADQMTREDIMAEHPTWRRFYPSLPTNTMYAYTTSTSSNPSLS